MQLLCLRNQKRTIIFHLERERMSFAAKNKLFPGQKCVFFLFPQQHADNHLPKHNIFWSREVSIKCFLPPRHVNISGHIPWFPVIGQKDNQFPVTGKVHASFPVGLCTQSIFSRRGDPATTFFRFRSLLVLKMDPDG